MPLANSTGDLFWDHPYPGFRICQNHTILAANPAAVEACGGNSVVGERCYTTIFGLTEKCARCPFDGDVSRPYEDRAVSGLKITVPGEDRLIRCILRQSHEGEPQCFEFVDPMPPLMLAMRSVHAIADQIRGTSTVENAIALVRKFLAGTPDSPRYRVRHYRPNGTDRPTQLECIWHDEPISPAREYVEGLRGQSMTRESMGDSPSFHCLENFCMVLVTADPEDLRFFQQNYSADQISAQVWRAKRGIFQDLRLYHVSPRDKVLRLFKDGLAHCWLDVPFGKKGDLSGKLSITPLGSGGRFTREEMEQFSVLRSLADLQIEGLRLRERDRRRILLEEVHEARQPAFQALLSVQLLRDRDKYRAGAAKPDPADYYIKKNIETAIRMVAFLNDAPSVSRDVPCSVSPFPTNIVGHVLAPIINMFRHDAFLTALTRNTMGISDVTLENLADLTLPRETQELKKVAFQLETSYDIYYAEDLERIALFIDQYRLQELFYNLFTNASKYRVEDQPFWLRILRRWDRDFPESTRHLFTHFYVIDVEDKGLGVRGAERCDIFRLGKRGWAAQRRLGTAGTGRGLFIVREVLLSMGGDIYVENLKDPTRFRLFIPAACRQFDWLSKLPETRQRMDELRKHLGDQVLPSDQ